MRTEPYIRSLNHVKITFLDIKPQMIKIDSILLHLAKTCRYHSMIHGWYSNAEHSILCAMKAPSRRIERECLVHDFGEHITQDVAGPIKKVCPDYDKLCTEVQDVMYMHFLGYKDVSPFVKIIDKKICASEQKYIRQAPDEDLEAIPYDDVGFFKWEWMEAYIKIQHFFIQLFPEYHDHD